MDPISSIPWARLTETCGSEYRDGYGLRIRSAALLLALSISLFGYDYHVIPESRGEAKKAEAEKAAVTRGCTGSCSSTGCGGRG